jgi:hypothetical protein
MLYQLTTAPQLLHFQSQRYVTTNDGSDSCEFTMSKPFLIRGRVCSLQLLLTLISTIIRGSKSHGTHNHILLSQIRSPYLYPSGTGWPSFTSRYWVHFFIASSVLQGCFTVLLITSQHGLHRKYHSFDPV